MPAFGSGRTVEELWSIIAYVEQLPATTSEVYARLKSELGSARQDDAVHHGGAGPLAAGRGCRPLRFINALFGAWPGCLRAPRPLPAG